MSRLRLTCLTLEYPPDKGGVASYLEGLLSALAAEVQVIRARSRSLWPHWWPMIRQCYKLDTDILMVSHLLPVGTAAWIAHLFGGPAYILVVHGMDILLAQRTWWTRWLSRQVVRGAYLVVANSAYTAGLAQTHFGRSAIALTPGYTAHALPSRTEARARLQVDPQEKIILSVARLVSRKGFDTLIEATAGLDARLVIIGNGPDEMRLRHLIQKTGDTSRVQILTHVSDEERDRWYAAADVFALLVREQPHDVEGFGIVYLEAAAAGLPIVAGQSGGVGEAVEDGVTGELVDPTSVTEAHAALSRLLVDVQGAKALGEAGKKRVEEKFNWKDRAQLLEDQLPLVSVIIPVFNRRKAFRRCLVSLTQQTYKHFEVITIDDGSGEDVRSVVNEYGQHLTIKHTRQVNQGAPHARNLGFAQSQGSYVLFLDADAKLVPDALERMTRVILEHPEADVVYSDHAFGWKLFRGRPFNHEALRRGNFIHTSSLIRRRAFPQFDEALKRFQDWDLWLTMAEEGRVFIWIPRMLYRLEKGGTMSAWMPSFIHRLPWEKIGWMPKRLKAYQEAEKIVKKKHGLHT